MTQTDERGPWRRALYYVVVACLIAPLGILHGCYDNHGPAAPLTPCPDGSKSFLGRCPTGTPVPAPPPPTCAAGQCPFALFFAHPFVSAPNVVQVEANPPGPFTLQVNGIFLTLPEGLALVRTGDFVSGSRCCGSTIVYVVF